MSLDSNEPGMYVFDASVGYPLIKNAMNQSYEVNKDLEMMP
jgi:hypothetical protein|tara:strand:+ start:1998 stop:2120 length:123 start_codon:yes stop_codon:yes gene_type:complete